MRVASAILLLLPAMALGQDRVKNSIGQELISIVPGTFKIGSPSSEPGRFDDEPQRTVTLTKRFHIAITEVTQAQYKAVTGDNPSHVRGDDLPVDSVSYADAVAFCRKLSEKEGKAYRLPTEAEWEHAARAGTTGPFSTDAVDAAAWHLDNGDDRPHPVAKKKPNPWGLHDVHGNAAEWCSDWYAATRPQGEMKDPTGPESGKVRVVRGGSWSHYPRAARSAARASANPSYQLKHVGFRVVMEVPD